MYSNQSVNVRKGRKREKKGRKREGGKKKRRAERRKQRERKREMKAGNQRGVLLQRGVVPHRGCWSRKKSPSGPQPSPVGSSRASVGFLPSQPPGPAAVKPSCSSILSADQVT